MSPDPESYSSFTKCEMCFMPRFSSYRTELFHVSHVRAKGKTKDASQSQQTPMISYTEESFLRSNLPRAMKWSTYSFMQKLSCSQDHKLQVHNFTLLTKCIPTHQGTKSGLQPKGTLANTDPWVLLSSPITMG